MAWSSTSRSTSTVLDELEGPPVPEGDDRYADRHGLDVDEPERFAIGRHCIDVSSGHEVRHVVTPTSEDDIVTNAELFGDRRQLLLVARSHLLAHDDQSGIGVRHRDTRHGTNEVARSFGREQAAHRQQQWGVFWYAELPSGVCGVGTVRLPIVEIDPIEDHTDPGRVVAAFDERVLDEIGHRDQRVGPLESPLTDPAHPLAVPDVHMHDRLRARQPSDNDGCRGVARAVVRMDELDLVAANGHGQAQKPCCRPPVLMMAAIRARPD